MNFKRLTWHCLICGRERPDTLISVIVHDMSRDIGQPAGTYKWNVRYCNDTPECERRARIRPKLPNQ